MPAGTGRVSEVGEASVDSRQTDSAGKCETI